MEYRQLGKTGMNVSTLSFGASSLGGMFRSVSEKEAIKTVHDALDRGINYIDVSPYYGLTKAETVLGKALRSIERERYFLATKIGRYNDDEFDFSAERTRQSIDASLKRLGVDYLDVVQCHDIEFVQIDKIIHHTIPLLRTLKKEGKCRFFGITGLPIRALEKTVEQTEIDTILSYARYTLYDQTLLSILPLLKKKQVGIINASPLALGLLSKRGAPDWVPATKQIRDHCRQTVRELTEKGINIEKLAIQFAVSNPEIHTTLVGTANPEHIKENIDWAETPIDTDILHMVQDKFAPIHNLEWPSGLPENN